MPVLVTTAVLYGASQLDSASGKRQAAERLSLKSINRIGDAHKAVHEEGQRTQQSVERLANRKFGILQTSIRKFVSSYERLMRINFRAGDGIKELADPALIDRNLELMRDIDVRVGSVVKSSDVAFLSSMLTSGGGLMCMGEMAAAAVGAPMFVGSMAMALNPMFLPATFAMALTKSLSDDAEHELKAARLQRKYANVVEAQAETNVEALRAIRERADRLTTLLTALNKLFIASLKEVDPIIERNGSERAKYSARDKEAIRNCLNLADAVKSILDTPLFESDGAIAEVSREALETGEMYLRSMEQVMMA